MSDLAGARGRSVYDADGEKIGNVEVVFYDAATGQASWLAIGTAMLGRRRSVVPAESLVPTERGYTIPHSKSFVREAPDVDRDEITERLEDDLRVHYGLPLADRAGGGEPASDPSAEGEQPAARLADERETIVIRPSGRSTYGAGERQREAATPPARSSRREPRRRTPIESRPFFLTSEFVVALLLVAALAVAAAVDDALDSPLLWTLVTVAVAFYALSRGLAKSGTNSRARDPREHRSQSP